MPELPEVETVRRDLLTRIIKKKITSVEVFKDRMVKVPKKKFISALLGRKIVDIERVGKLLVLTIDTGEYLLIHLKMTGQLIYRDKKQQIGGGHSLSKEESNFQVPNKHTYIIIAFAGGGKLFFNDQRTFGYMTIVSEEELGLIKKRFGVEPLSWNFTLEHFTSIIKNKKTSIKAALLDQRLIAGIGNIYADESCFLAGIKPTRLANSLTAKERQKLFTAIRDVLDLAVRERGTTFNHFVDGEGKRGNFLSFLKVYGRNGERCLVCKDGIIEKSRVAGRGTHVCGVCQK